MNYTKYEYLYLDIKKEASNDKYAKVIFDAIKHFAKENKNITFDRHECTVKALESILNEISTHHNITGKIMYPSTVKMYINRYLQIEEHPIEDEDIPSLKYDE